MNDILGFLLVFSPFILVLIFSITISVAESHRLRDKEDLAIGIFKERLINNKEDNCLIILDSIKELMDSNIPLHKIKTALDECKYGNVSVENVMKIKKTLKW